MSTGTDGGCFAYTLSQAFFLLMPPITAVLLTKNDALRLGRCLETLYPCDHIIVVDHGSQDHTLSLAREYGARIVKAMPGVPRLGSYGSPGSSWLLFLDPRESLSESLAASLYEWRWGGDPHSPYSLFLREETAQGWSELPRAQTRLVPRNWDRWDGMLPADISCPALEGPLLRFAFP